VVKIDERNGRVRFAVHVQPRSARTEIVGIHGDALKVKLQAPPVDNAANDALVDLLARELHVTRQHVRLVAGATSRTKVVEVDGVSRERVQHLITDG
jgi:uncharacterized protein